MWCRNKKPKTTGEKVDAIMECINANCRDTDSLASVFIALIDALSSIDQDSWQKILDECSPEMHCEVQRLMKFVNNTSNVNS